MQAAGCDSFFVSCKWAHSGSAQVIYSSSLGECCPAGRWNVPKRVDAFDWVWAHSAAVHLCIHPVALSAVKSSIKNRCDSSTGSHTCSSHKQKQPCWSDGVVLWLFLCSPSLFLFASFRWRKIFVSVHWTLFHSPPIPPSFLVFVICSWPLCFLGWPRVCTCSGHEIVDTYRKRKTIFTYWIHDCLPVFIRTITSLSWSRRQDRFDHVVIY